MSLSKGSAFQVSQAQVDWELWEDGGKCKFSVCPVQQEVSNTPLCVLSHWENTRASPWGGGDSGVKVGSGLEGLFSKRHTHPALPGEQSGSFPGASGRALEMSLYVCRAMRETPGLSEGVTRGLL